ncbi:hypothetical protein [Streptococcus suis]|uniref:hypothetical protein n=1 Tax=Streptococcus suis TaxID=1307 RepID=UPI002412D0B0|nr:hypothetical protein [Streptococcus suis]MDG4529732.1 hypothetical protein [Streptococcus suis]
MKNIKFRLVGIILSITVVIGGMFWLNQEASANTVKLPIQSQTGKIHVHRMYNPALKVHLYTVDENEVIVLQIRGWNYDGVAWNTAKVGNIPVYRLYHPILKVHLYTKDKNEYKVLSSRGWSQEGTSFYSRGSQPIYRLYHSGIQKHLFTRDFNEYQVLSQRGWKQEGIAWYSVAETITPPSTTKPSSSSQSTTKPSSSSQSSTKPSSSPQSTTKPSSSSQSTIKPSSSSQSSNKPSSSSQSSTKPSSSSQSSTKPSSSSQSTTKPSSSSQSTTKPSSSSQSTTTPSSSSTSTSTVSSNTVTRTPSYIKQKADEFLATLPDVRNANAYSSYSSLNTHYSALLDSTNQTSLVTELSKGAYSYANSNRQLASTPLTTYLLSLNDRFTDRLLQNINQFRSSIGLPSLSKLGMTDDMKRSFASHVIYNYLYNNHSNSKIRQQLDTTYGLNSIESMQPQHTVSSRSELTPEALADNFIRAILNEASSYANNDGGETGHLLQLIDEKQKYIYSGLFIYNYTQTDAIVTIYGKQVVIGKNYNYSISTTLHYYE